MNKNKTLVWVLIALPLAAQAMEFEFGSSGIQLAVDSTITYGAQWRVEGRDSKITGKAFINQLQDDPLLPVSQPSYTQGQTVIINGNDGNNNFNTGLISNRLTLLVDMDLNWENYGFFVRGKAFYDAAYHGDSDLDEFGYITYNSGKLYGGDANRGDFPDGTVGQHGDDFRILDYFAYATWEIPGNRLLDLRIGRQAINWGESTFYQGINSIQNRVDATAANTPGVEVKEIFLPTGTFYLQFDVLDSLTFEAYYQYEWLENELNGVGSYFSTNDQIGPGAHSFLIPTPEFAGGNEYQLNAVLRDSDDNASSSGQWGLASHYVTESNWDIGLYHAVGHDKKPSFVLSYIDIAGFRVPQDYYLKYYEDIEATAISFTTVIGETNVQGELSYLDGTPMVNEAGDPERENLAKLQLGGAHVFGPSFIADDTVLTMEAFYADVTSAGGDELIGDGHAWGYSFLAEFSYNNVFQGWDVKVPIYVKHDMEGIVQEIQHFEGAKVISMGLTGIYLNNATVNFSYSNYFGGGEDNLLIDRDNVAVTVKYSF